jgi:D-aminoacyl-tRNA deacylase
MKALIQRVKKAKVTVNGEITGAIDDGMLVFIGVEKDDNKEDLAYICKKIVNLRIFSDAEGKMNHSIIDKEYNILLISQFTLTANTKKGNRPSFIEAAAPEIAVEMYQEMIETLSLVMGKKIQTGIFGADMQVELINDGPVTIPIQSR